MFYNCSGMKWKLVFDAQSTMTVIPGQILQPNGSASKSGYVLCRRCWAAINFNNNSSVFVSCLVDKGEHTAFYESNKKYIL